MSSRNSLTAASAELLVEKLRAGDDGEVGAAIAVVALSADRASKEVSIRNDMIRVAHDVGASIRQIADASGLGRKTVTAIVEAEAET